MLRPATTNYILWFSVTGLLIATFIWMLWPRAVDVDVQVIDEGPVSQELVDEGRTRIHNVFVITAPVSGDLQRISVEPGDPVARGQVVASIYPAPPSLLDSRSAAQAQSNILAAAAALRSAEADLALAQRDQTRTRALFARGFASQAAVDADKTQVDAARATVSARQANLRHAQLAAGATEGVSDLVTHIRSPVSGRVLQLYQQSQTVAPAGSALIDIGDPADLEIVAEFLSQDAVQIREGLNAFVENWGGVDAIPAIVTRIEPYAHTKVSALGVEEQRVNVIARLSSPATAPPLGHGFRVDLRVIVSQKPNVVRVPSDALFRTGSSWSVFRVVQGKAMITAVSVDTTPGHYRAVLGGLSPGDMVILFPPSTLKSGDSVKART